MIYRVGSWVSRWKDYYGGVTDPAYRGIILEVSSEILTWDCPTSVPIYLIYLPFKDVSLWCREHQLSPITPTEDELVLGLTRLLEE